MRQYKALQPCRFAGKDFLIGDFIPAELVLPEAVDNLISIGVIDAVDIPSMAGVLETDESSVNMVPVSILGEEESECIPMTADDVAWVLIILQKPPAEAAKDVQNITSRDVLTLLKAVDKRKAVKTALETVVIDDDAGVHSAGGTAEAADEVLV